MRATGAALGGRSTGPKTAGGKAVSSMNAVKHGLTARTPLLAGEDAAAFREFVWEVIEDLAPVGRVQHELAARAAVFMWKRQRVAEAERQVLAELSQRYVRDLDEENGRRKPDPDEAWAEREVPVDPDDPLKLVRFVIADEFATEKPTQLERLAYYERRIDQQIDGALRTLVRLQNRQQMQGSANGHDGQRGQHWRDGDEAAEPAAGPAREARRDEPEAVPAGKVNAVPPSPHAPAQNELSSTEGPAPETGPPGAGP